MSQTLQEYVQDILNGVRTNLNTPGNSFYLPTWLTANGYDPYGQDVAMNWPFTLTGADVLNTFSNICSDIGGANPSICPSFKDSYIGDPANAPVLTLGGVPGDLLVKGFSNAVISSMTANNDAIPMQISAVMTFSTIPNMQSQPTVSGNFNLLQYCCCSTSNTGPCTGASTPYNGTGTFVTTLTGSATATVDFEISDLAQGVLDLEVTSITLVPPMDGSGNPNLNTVVQILSFPPGTNSASYNNLAQGAFNSPSGRTNIIQQINTVMNQQGQLDTMTTAMTKVIDQYLKSNNLYPFNTASLALY
jgi:hypothetical protein